MITKYGEHYGRHGEELNSSTEGLGPDGQEASIKEGAFRLRLKRRGCSIWQIIENIPKMCHKPRQGRAEQDAFKEEETVIVDEA